MQLQTSLIRWLLLLSGNIALNTLGLSSRYSSNKACEIKKKKTSISSQFTSNGKCMSQEREREREREGGLLTPGDSERGRSVKILEV